LESGSPDCTGIRLTGNLCGLRAPRFACLALMLAALFLPANPAWAEQAESPNPEPALPETPGPQLPAPSGVPAAKPCPARSGVIPQSGTEPAPPPCPPPPTINWYQRFTNGPQVKPMTPREKGWLALRNVADPFNAITILGDAGIAVGYNAYSPYGPGMAGFGRYVGVSFTQDLTGELFGTFLIPAIVHQDPHYHRMPDASIPRRAAHAILQVVWTQGDNGKGMVNYADLVGFAIDDELGNLYVPGQQTNLPASGARYGIGLASAPIENFITEFLPDVARRIHIRVVVFQRIVNQVAKTESSGSQ
jgi:hypothetical protein